MLQPRDFPLQAPMLVASAGNAGFAPAPAWRVEKPRVAQRSILNIVILAAGGLTIEVLL
jgi:hypothetical protein